MQIKEIDVRQAEFAHHKSRVYIFANVSLVTDLMERMLGGRRLNKKAAFYRKYVLSYVYEKLGWTKDVQCQWSRTAGCSCGCSPGFVVKGDYGKSIFVTLAD